MTQPHRADLYVRLSELHDDHAASLTDQERRLREHAGRLGWGVRRVVVENDINGDGRPKPASAFKRRKVAVPGSERRQLRVVRPGFRSIVEDLMTGRSDGLLALDLDRAVRDPRDLEDLIDAVEQYGARVESVTGSLKLACDADITMARVMVAMGNKSSRDTGRRVSASRERRAREGRFGGGKRPYGFAADGLTVLPAEQEVIRDAAHAIVHGSSLRGLARDLRDRGVPTATGAAAWSAETLRDILVRPRNAGLMQWRDQSYPAPWDPIVAPDVHNQVVAILNDPERSTGPGRPPRWLGSGIYLCGVCLDGTTCKVTVAGRHPRYHCKTCRRFTRHAIRTDEVVVAFAVEYLALHGGELLTPDRPEVDVAGLRAEHTAISERLAGVGGDVVLGLMTRAAGHDATRRARVRLAEIDATLGAAVGGDPLARWASADPAEVWENAVLEERRQLLRRLLVVTILPVGAGGRFKPESVRVEPRARRITTV
ncbi:MAG: recombinase family protein [Micromonosporaceae bacterium]